MARGRHQLHTTPWVGLGAAAVVTMVVGAALIFYLAPWLRDAARTVSAPPPDPPALVQAPPMAPPTTVWRLPRPAHSTPRRAAPPSTTDAVDAPLTCTAN